MSIKIPKKVDKMTLNVMLRETSQIGCLQLKLAHELDQ